jgi:hypothetical protein
VDLRRNDVDFEGISLTVARDVGGLACFVPNSGVGDSTRLMRLLCIGPFEEDVCVKREILVYGL